MSCIEDSTEPPEWLEKLENRIKKGHRLAHEVGCGSPCLQCLDQCQGLDLHFWRKICRNCNCKKEAHDVKEESVDVHFNIVFGKKSIQNMIPQKISMVLDKNKKNASVEEIEIDWLPPNVSTDLAGKYLQSFPRNRIPITGTSGASYRITQMKKQIPLHDLDPKFCHQLSTEEKKCLELYSKGVKEHAVGQAQVVLAPVVSLVNSEHQDKKVAHYSRPCHYPLPLPTNSVPSTPEQTDVIPSAKGVGISTQLQSFMDSQKMDNIPVKSGGDWNSHGTGERNSNWVDMRNLQINDSKQPYGSSSPLGTDLEIENKNLHLPASHCLKCEAVIAPGEVAISIKKNNLPHLWHPECFVCTTCQEFLTDLIYFIKDGKVYCGRDYAVVCDIPRCFSCDELIFAKEYTMTEGKSYHLHHFCCYCCDKLLANHDYITKLNNPVCLDCFSSKYAKLCSSCGNKILATDSGIDVSDVSWHATPSCFNCFTCKKSLIQSKFVVKNTKPFCSKDCYLKSVESN